ncbi:MAG: hypothetical protein E6G17_07550 [Actinobacteria bacterium]|nr:MAG: hypothetical protein E6G17_07550 [Actinomycetota bacterium]
MNYAKSHGAIAVSNSYGGGEWSGEAGYNSVYSPGATNQVITVSSGDSGYGVEFPAAAPGVVAVGGTSLSMSGTTRLGETAWSGAGSGCSAVESKPSNQSDPSCSRRTVADVSADADPNTGVAVYDSYGSSGGANWYQFGGTSVASPIIASVYALGGGGSASNTYAARSYTVNMNDVTSGSNGRCTFSGNPHKTSSSTAAYLCTAVAGYDGPTGLGTPKGTGAF